MSSQCFKFLLNSFQNSSDVIYSNSSLSAKYTPVSLYMKALSFRIIFLSFLQLNEVFIIWFVIFIRAILVELIFIWIVFCRKISVRYIIIYFIKFVHYSLF